MIIFEKGKSVIFVSLFVYFSLSRSELLLDQYRKKSQLYRTNVVFIQLGDDFRYSSMDEARKQFESYDKLFTYMNKQADWNVDVRFRFVFY
jgi:alpha-mannosidase II